MLRVGGDEAVFLQIGVAFRNELLMRGVGTDSGTEAFGEVEAFRIRHVASEERPCTADVGLDDVNGATLPRAEKDAIAVLAGPHLPFPVSEYAVGIEKGLLFEVQSFVEPLQILGREDDASLAFAALAAHLAIKNRFHHLSLIHI